MIKISAFMAEGTEEAELISVVDILRRAGLYVEIVSTTGNRLVESSHGIYIETDQLFEEADFTDTDVFFLPGGVRGVRNLQSHQELSRLLLVADKAGKRLAAICAGPTVLGKLGLLDGRKATCYPGFETELGQAEYTGDGVTTDGRFTTGRGMGFSVDLGIELVRILCGIDHAEDLKAKIQHPDCI